MLLKGDYKLVVKAVTHQGNHNKEEEKDDNIMELPSSKPQQQQEAASMEFELFHLKLNPGERVDGEFEFEAACNSIFNNEK
jgi:hypothetical protein